VVEEAQEKNPEAFIKFEEFNDIKDLLAHVDRIEAVVNATNTKVTFGDGISGAIGKATGQAGDINREARKLIDEFNKVVGRRTETPERRTGENRRAIPER